MINCFLKDTELMFLEPIVDSEGRTPLHWAVDRGHLNITELLVSKNADVNAKVILIPLLTYWIKKYICYWLFCK